MKDMVAAAECARALNGDKIGDARHDAKHRALAPRIETDRAARSGREIAAFLASPDDLMKRRERSAERPGELLIALQKMECEPRGRPLADAGQTREQADELGDRIVHCVLYEPRDF